MVMRHFCRFLFPLLLAGICSNTLAQYAYGAPTYTWKKQVSRIVDIPGQKGRPAKARKRQKTLYQLILDGWKTGDITLYTNADQAFSYKLDSEAVEAIIDANPFTCRLLPRYRILEEWTYNPTTGKTEMQITGIAPMRDVYGPNGEYRGRQAIFWITYGDYSKLIARDEQLHGEQALISCIWHSYVQQNTATTKKATGWQTKATRHITLPVRNDAVNDRLIEYSTNSLFEVLRQHQCSWPDSIPSYTSSDFTAALARWAVIDSDLQKIDTQMITDPVSNIDVVKYMPHNFHNDNIAEYFVADKYVLNPDAGKLDVEILGVTPLARHATFPTDGPGSKVAPLFWMKYKDVWPIILKYDQYHPECSFGLGLWASYFKMAE